MTAVKISFEAYDNISVWNNFRISFTSPSSEIQLRLDVKTLSKTDFQCMIFLLEFLF